VFATIKESDVKVFISSVIAGFEAHRDATVQAARSLGHQVIRAEDFGASPASPQQVCLQGVRDADVVVLLLGARYGSPQASGLSPTHEEFREARDLRPVLVFVQKGIAREAKQEEFISEARSWSTGNYTADFTTPDDLRMVMTRALHQYELSLAAGSADVSDMLTRANQLIASAHAVHSPNLCLAIVGGPNQQVIRPSELSDAVLSNVLKREAQFGPFAIFDDEHGAAATVLDSDLIVSQAASQSSLVLNESGTIRIIQPAVRKRNALAAELSALIEEDIMSRLVRGMGFAGWTLEKIDPLHRITDIVVAAAILQANYLGWQTQSEHAASPHMTSISPRSMTAEQVPVHLTPARLNRAALIHDSARIAEDLTVLLRRSFGR
jgi:hypothetical protein